MAEAVIGRSGDGLTGMGPSFGMKEWSHGPMAGPPLHVHHSDDEAWHVLEGSLAFRFADGTAEASVGTTVFVPAGVAHTFGNPGPGDVRYLIVTTPRVFALIEALHASDQDAATIYRAHDSELLE